jgi:hypothetical protein
MTLLECYSGNGFLDLLTATEVVRFSPAEIQVLPGQVARLAGGSRYRMDPPRQTLAEEVLMDARQLVDLSVTYRVHRVLKSLPDGSALLECGSSFPLSKNTQPEAARFAAFAVCTVGRRLDEHVQVLFSSKDSLRAFFLDAAGTAYLENLAEKTRQMLEEETLRRGFSTACRGGPGYSGMDLSCQRQLFDLVDASAIGVHLNERQVMDPPKSLSFFSVWTTGHAQKDETHKCASCNLNPCAYRI